MGSRTSRSCRSAQRLASLRFRRASTKDSRGATANLRVPALLIAYSGDHRMFCDSHVTAALFLNYRNPAPFRVRTVFTKQWQSRFQRLKRRQTAKEWLGELMHYNREVEYILRSLSYLDEDCVLVQRALCNRLFNTNLILKYRQF